MSLNDKKILLDLPNPYSEKSLEYIQIALNRYHTSFMLIVILFKFLQKAYITSFFSFFVISGYFMALILLTPKKDKSFTTFTLSFYYRRIYRILPLYLVNIFATLIIVPALSFTMSPHIFISQLKAALSFSINFSMYFEDLNYFNINQSFQWFKHYWSLCVEMQFYAIIPFLAYLCRKCPTSVSLFVIWPLLIGASQALSLYMLINYGEKGNNFTFGMLPTRIWQFAGGFCAFYAIKFIESFQPSKIVQFLLQILRHSVTANILTGLLLTVTLFPTAHDQAYAQIITISLTSILIAAVGKAKEKDELQFSILANKIVVYIGDASYALYISHWILVIISRAFYERNEANRRLVFTLCFVIGIIVHKFIEKPIVKRKFWPKDFFPAIFVAYSLIAFGIYSMDTSPPKFSSFVKDLYHNQSKLITNPEEWSRISGSINAKIASELALYGLQAESYPQSAFADSFNNATHSEIRGAELKGTGNLSILVLGNSHAQCFFPAAEDSLNGMFSELNLFVTGGATPFEGFFYSRTWRFLKDAVLHYKPDVIFFIFKYQPDMDFPPTEPISKDLGTIKIQEMINFLKNYSKVLLISDIHFEAFHFNSLVFAEAMHYNGWTSNYQFPKSDLINRHITSTRRWKEIKCQDCIFIDLLEAYCKDEICSPVDETSKVSLTSDDNHLTLFGAHLLKPILQKNIKKMNQLLLNL